ncbi:transcriptional repressor [filamentous cyanobacterium LEGE 11480]|uniref:Transcriptional repressor n=1 Tax=Romeriopsis navalis LEGE 11480 TaxID=2777977 RepID=A0A928Z5Q3_9CYAN|nr:Fur family transcriptional regulator [Romeriopsis navalis]MBE9032222.1 transcriptional repressor [Romeriopsis navalis LEGE 11480]
MPQPTTQIIQQLKAKGLRVTPQRFAVYANLLDRADHPTAEQVLFDLNQDAPTSSQSTVYSSLQALCKVGLVREVLLEEGVCRYDANVAPHHHFRCRICGTIEDIAWDQLQGIQIDRLRPGLQVESYEVTLHGCCEHCPPEA